ncbi:MAG: hypothetical protein JW759_09630 [Candidatus Coatesbacteria bacterium]|nr:hypothetical protein [Candidatus Coatesbacteria bacterium]
MQAGNGTIKRQQGADLFIVDNSDDLWKVGKCLNDWCEIARSMDIATGCFEIGSLLSLDGQWQKLGKIRILMGDELAERTRKPLTSDGECCEQEAVSPMQGAKGQQL